MAIEVQPSREATARRAIAATSGGGLGSGGSPNRHIHELLGCIASTSRAAQPIHNRGTKTMLGKLLCHNEVQTKMVEFAQTTKEIYGRIAKMASFAELTDLCVLVRLFHRMPGKQSHPLIFWRKKIFRF